MTWIVGVLDAVFAMRSIVTQLRNFLYGEKMSRNLKEFTSIRSVWSHLSSLWSRVKLMQLLRNQLVAAACGLAAIACTSPAYAQGAPSVAGVTKASGVGAGNLDGRTTAKPGAPVRRWITVPRINGRITAKTLGLVINTADPYSVEVGNYYASARHLAPEQVLRLDLPLKTTLTAAEFATFSAKIQSHFGPSTEALALAWTMPYAVECNSITGALALGYDETLCAHSCSASKASAYFGKATSRPFTDLKMRPSMLLAAHDVEAAKAMIQRGVASDGSQGLRGAVPVNAYFVTTNDPARSARSPLFPPAGLLRRQGVDVHVETTQALENVNNLLVYMTGLVKIEKLETLKWVPGGVGDHLTSTGGQLVGGGGQMSILDWIGSGATASYGTVSEPCAHPQKFPHPQIMMLNYVQGSTVLEAYWKSVAWPQQGIFIGEPLAAPFARQ